VVVTQLCYNYSEESTLLSDMREEEEEEEEEKSEVSSWQAKPRAFLISREEGASLSSGDHHNYKATQ